jgi:hypothetical protein
MFVEPRSSVAMVLLPIFAANGAVTGICLNDIAVFLCSVGASSSPASEEAEIPLIIENLVPEDPSGMTSRKQTCKATKT